MATNHKTDLDTKELLLKAQELEKLKADHQRVLNELREARHELEIRVKVRTAEIAKINEELHREMAQRRKTEDTLKAIGLQYINAFDSMPEPIHIVDSDLRVIVCNRALVEWNRQLGLEADSVIAKSVFDIYPFLPAKVRDEYEKVFKEGQVLLTEEFTGVGGKNFITETRKIPILENGKVLRVITVLTDITEQKEHEARLRAEKEKAEAYLNVIGVILVAIDSKGKVSLINNKGCQILGYSQEEIIGKDWFDNFIPENEREKVRAAFSAIISGEKDLDFEFFENRVLTKEGERVIYWHNTVLRDAEGEVISSLSSGEDVSEQIKTQEALAASEQKFRTIFNSAYEGLVVADTQSKKFVFANPSFCRIFGYEESEISGLCVQDLHPEEDLEHIFSVFEKGAREGNFFENNVQVKRKDGSTFYANISGTRVDFNGGQYMLGAFHDVTERLEREKELRQTKERFEYILSATKTNVDVIDADFNILYIDPAWKQVYKEPYGRKCYEYFMGRSQICPNCGLTKALGSKQIVITEEILPREDNRVIEVHSIPFQGDDGKWLVAEFNIDISERKKAEDALREGEKRYRAIVENSKDVIMLTSPEGIITYISPAAEWALGYKPKELVGKQPWITHPQDTSKVQEAHYKALKGEAGERFQYRVVTKSGDVRWVSHSWSPIAKGEKVESIVSIIRDITESREFEDKLELMNREIREKNVRLEQLAVKDSHTGLYNHRYLEEIIEVEFDRAKRYGNPFSAVMIDVDYFKSINDVYGHQFGDLILQQLAEQLKKKLRRYDVVIRYGGEEFVVLSPATDKPTAINLAQRLLDSINLHRFGNSRQRVRLKLSLAVASYPEDKIGKGMDLIELADRVLNKAKESGGNRVYSLSDLKKEKLSPLLKNGRESEGVKYLKDKIDKLNKRANQSLIEAISAFAKAIEIKDRHTGRHVEMTVSYATEMAKQVSLTKEEIENIRQASILHDLGKIGISEKILLKRAKLSKKEFDEIKKHPQIGVDIIRPLHFLHDIIPLMLYHHERWDGFGYPHGLKGEDIPIGARIIAIADAYQALISNRPYRKAYPKEKAVKIIKQDAGTHFDPELVDIFLNVIRKKKK